MEFVLFDKKIMLSPRLLDCNFVVCSSQLCHCWRNYL